MEGRGGIEVGVTGKYGRGAVRGGGAGGMGVELGEAIGLELRGNVVGVQ